tara:strand:- start:4976 stop:5347 length:372 start_codon:yes stop_codon:yes gene_type:complete
MEISGNIKWIDLVKTYGNNGFRKREFVVTTDEQYPQNIIIEFVNDKCELLDSFEVNDSVKVSINLRGREWVNPEGETKYFNSIQAWRIEKLRDDAVSEISSTLENNFEKSDELDNEVEDDLPF